MQCIHSKNLFVSKHEDDNVLKGDGVIILWGFFLLLHVLQVTTSTLVSSILCDVDILALFHKAGNASQFRRLQLYRFVEISVLRCYY